MIAGGEPLSCSAVSAAFAAAEVARSKAASTALASSDSPPVLPTLRVGLAWFHVMGDMVCDGGGGRCLECGLRLAGGAFS